MNDRIIAIIIFIIILLIMFIGGNWLVNKIDDYFDDHPIIK
jgi:uncharacterized protein YneF (UPF0154 family)